MISTTISSTNVKPRRRSESPLLGDAGRQAFRVELASK
jgi:hypothetical protein